MLVTFVHIKRTQNVPEKEDTCLKMFIKRERQQKYNYIKKIKK